MDIGDVPTGGLFGAADAHYRSPARAAVVAAADPRFARIVAERAVPVPAAAPYRPGQFYLRELPPLLAVLDGFGRLDLLVIDGYVDLDPGGRPGLGAHLYAALGVPVVGVAKSAFATATHAIAVRRGASARPLFVTAMGIGREQAARLVGDMAGPFRIPDALRRADALARGQMPPLAPAREAGTKHPAPEAGP
jgi:deoxyribonuclease V